MRFLGLILSLFSGALITLQTGSNTELKKSLNQPLYALIVNYFVGVAAVVIYTAIRRVPIPSLGQAAEAPWWAWLGGLFGAAYGLAAIFFASQLGAATLTALVVTGQLICAVTLDHFGWWSFDVHPAGVGRITGCVLMALGLLLIAKN
jgi:transporter family-2 protein